MRFGQISADLFGRTIYIPPIGEYVADGAAKQASWALSGKDEVPSWYLGEVKEISPKARIDGVIDSYFELISLSR